MLRRSFFNLIMVPFLKFKKRTITPLKKVQSIECLNRLPGLDECISAALEDKKLIVPKYLISTYHYHNGFKIRYKIVKPRNCGCRSVQDRKAYEEYSNKLHSLYFTMRNENATD